MVDEEKQTNNTANQQSDQTSKGERAMTSETTAETMNLNNEESTAANAQVASANPPTDDATVDENAAAPTEAADYQQMLSEITTQVESLRTQLEERNSQYMRLVADFDNFRKRSSKEKEDLEQQVKRNTILDLLPIVDNFERARSQLKPQEGTAEMSIHKSYQSIYKQLVDGLKRLGVSAMRPEGKEFDPNLHEAVMRQPTNEYPEGTVLEEFQRGYFLGDQVLRHALVKVATAPEEPVATSEESNSSAAEG